MLGNTEGASRSAPLMNEVRPAALDVRGQQPSLFPFDAFNFDDPNRTVNPELKMKQPWRFVADYIKSSGEPWNYQGKIGVLPDAAYYSALRDNTETAAALLNRVADDILPSEGVSGLFDGSEPYTVSGTVQYDLSAIPAYAVDGGYTVIVYAEGEGWNYLSGSGAVYGGIISKSGDILTIKSDNFLPLTLPFLLLSNLSTFRDLIIIPQNYTEGTILDLIDGVDTFSWEDGAMSADRGFILSPDGFYWYNGGQYISLGTEAIFSGVDLKSGQWDGKIVNGLIASGGTKGWAISSKGDVEFNDGTFRGDIRAESITLSKKASMPFLNFEARGTITNIEVDLINDTAEEVYNKLDSLYGATWRSTYSYVYSLGWYHTEYLPIVLVNTDSEYRPFISSGVDTLGYSYLMKRYLSSGTFEYGLANTLSTVSVGNTIVNNSAGYNKYLFDLTGSNTFNISEYTYNTNITGSVIINDDLIATGHISAKGGMSLSKSYSFGYKSNVYYYLLYASNKTAGTVNGWVENTSGVRYPAIITIRTSTYATIYWNGSSHNYLATDTSVATDIKYVWL